MIYKICYIDVHISCNLKLAFSREREFPFLYKKKRVQYCSFQRNLWPTPVPGPSEPENTHGVLAITCYTVVNCSCKLQFFYPFERGNPFFMKIMQDVSLKRDFWSSPPACSDIIRVPTFSKWYMNDHPYPLNMFIELG